jgi:hypothetical protein
MKTLSRSTALKVAAASAFLNGSSGLAMSLPLIGRGAANLDISNDSPPYIIVMTSLVLSILLLIGAYGTWKQLRWGIVLTLMISAFGAISAVPGISVAPTTALWLEAIFGVIAGIATCILCLWRDPKRAPA